MKCSRPRRIGEQRGSSRWTHQDLTARNRVAYTRASVFIQTAELMRVNDLADTPQSNSPNGSAACQQDKIQNLLCGLTCN